MARPSRAEAWPLHHTAMLRFATHSPRKRVARTLGRGSELAERKNRLKTNEIHVVDQRFRLSRLGFESVSTLATLSDFELFTGQLAGGQALTAQALRRLTRLA